MSLHSTKMLYLKKIIKSLKEIIIINILQYILIIISSLIYIITGHKKLNEFLNSYCSFILILFYIITIIYLYKKNKRKEIKLNKKYYLPLISLGISIACLLNMMIFLLTKPTITNKINLQILFISSGIIGPIYEEILFRYILLNRLKKFNTQKKSIIISTIMFSILHLSPIKIIYAFIIGIVLAIIYQKTNNIISSIIIHISANIISLLLNQYNLYILTLSVLNLLLLWHISKTKHFKT